MILAHNCVKLLLYEQDNNLVQFYKTLLKRHVPFMWIINGLIAKLDSGKFAVFWSPYHKNWSCKNFGPYGKLLEISVTKLTLNVFDAKKQFCLN